MAKTKVVFIGNSIVNGFPHKRSQCFASLFRAATEWEVINKGENGETTSAVLARFEKDALQHKPDFVYILSATNDFIYGECEPAETLAMFDEMVKSAAIAGCRVILLTPLAIDAEMATERWIPNIDYQRVSRQLEELARLMLSYGKENSVPVIDTQAFYRSLYTRENRDEWLRDGLHPTVAGHQALAAFLAESLPS